jgi:hypothetical protein
MCCPRTRNAWAHLTGTVSLPLRELDGAVGGAGIASVRRADDRSAWGTILHELRRVN